MDRVKTGGYSATIEAALNVIPRPIHHLVRADFLCGTDPIFAGLHQFESASFDRSYRDIAHVTYVHHQPHMARADRRTTVVLPEVPSVKTLVHELGHVLHSRMNWQPVAKPVSWYAETNRFEAFAEAFTAWLLPGYASQVDAATLHLLDGLATSAG